MDHKTRIEITPFRIIPLYRNNNTSPSRSFLLRADDRIVYDPEITKNPIYMDDLVEVCTMATCLLLYNTKYITGFACTRIAQCLVRGSENTTSAIFGK